MKAGRKVFLGIALVCACVIAVLAAHTVQSVRVITAVKAGQTKSELAKATFGLWQLKPQVVRKRFENMTDVEVRNRAVSGGNAISGLMPEPLKSSMPIDGSVAVYSYVVALRPNIPNGIILTYLSVFYDTKADKVLGSRVYEDYAEGVKTWDGVR